MFIASSSGVHKNASKIRIRPLSMLRYYELIDMRVAKLLFPTCAGIAMVVLWVNFVMCDLYTLS